MKIFLTLTFFIATTAIAFTQPNDSSIAFTPNLNFSYFKGTPDNDTSAARISTALNVGVKGVSIWTGKISFKAWATMNPFESWVRPGYADESTLQHEQTHFNITAICARNLQTALNAAKISSMKSPKISTIRSEWQAKTEALQAQYDWETRNGNDSIQIYWNEKILKELNFPR